jgi:transposase
MDKEPTLFVGVDWASKEHQVCTIGTGEPQQRAFPLDADGLGAMVAWLLDQAPASEIAIAIETPHGPAVEALMDRGVAVFAINPKQLDRFRDRFSPAGAKDDRRDALVLASSLKTDRHCFRRLETLDPLIVELREWSRMTDALKDERTRLTNRIRQQLWRYFPQALELTDDVGAEWFLDILALAPTPSVTAKLTVKKLARILSAHRIRRLSADDALAQLRRPALTVAAGTAEAASAHVLKMAERVRLVNRQIKDATRRLDALTAAIAGPEPDEDAAPRQPVEQHDATILRSLPGVGRPIS